MLSTLLQHLNPKFLIPNITAGIVIGLINLALTISYAAIIFTGDLSPFLGAGIGIALMSSFAVGIILALFSPLKGSIAAIQDVPAAIIAASSVVMLGELAPDLKGNEAYITVVAFCGLTTLLTAIVFLLLGYFRLAKLVRFLPYPVIGGFLAGTGWLLTTAGLGLMTNLQPDLANLAKLFQPSYLSYWWFGALLGIFMLIISARVNHSFAIPLTLVGATFLFFLGMFASGASISSWQAAGFFLGPFPDQGLWRPISLADLSNVRWGLLFSQVAQAATIIISCLIALLLNATGVELAVEQDIDLNKELWVSGWANVVLGLLGGVAGYLLISDTVLNHKVGNGSRFGAVLAALVCLLALVVGASFLAFFPKPIVGSLLMYLGLGFLYDWLYKTFFTLSRLEYIIILLILSVIISVGFLEGIGVGLVAAVILFIVSYSRTSVIKHELSGSTLRSRVSRNFNEQTHLDAHGEETFILQLQGYLFFGTANTLLETIKTRVEQASPLKGIILDFEQVSGLDATALSSFAKMIQLSEKTGTQLLLSALPDKLKTSFEHLNANGVLHFFTSLDYALEHCENLLLQANHEPTAAYGLRDRLLKLEPEGTNLDKLLSYFEKLEYKSGDYLMKHGDKADDLFFIESGQVTARLDQAGKALRFETVQGGSIVGELGFYSGAERSASVIADDVTVAYRLTKDKLEQMTQEAPQSAALFHEFNMRLLANRTAHLMNVVSALQR